VRLLLDTCAFIWMVDGSDELSRRIRELVASAENELFLSAASVWEISLKFRLGKLAFESAPVETVSELRELHRVVSLPISEEAAVHTMRLPSLHRDPFDRMLVSQAIVDELTILTPDQEIRQYAVRSIW
jgi:PIN domain nuclease of toxin-antitoxin system